MLHQWGELRGLRGGDGEGLGVLRQRVEAEGGFGDDGEGAEAAGEKLAEVVTGDVFDDLAAGAGDGPSARTRVMPMTRSRRLP